MTRINPAAYRRRHTMYADALIDRASAIVEQVALHNANTDAMRQRMDIHTQAVRAEALRIAQLNARAEIVRNE